MLFIGLLAISQTLIARDQGEILKDGTKAAKSAVATYKKGGVSGLISATEGCYEKLQSRISPYCLYLDLASARTDQIYSGIINAPRHDFFAVENFVMRAKTVLDKTSIPEGEKGEYLQTIATFMTQVTDSEIMKGHK